MVLPNERNFIHQKKNNNNKKKKTNPKNPKDKDTGCFLWLYIKLDFQYFTNKFKVKPS